MNWGALIAVAIVLAVALFLVWLQPVGYHVDRVTIIQTRLGYGFHGLVSFHLGNMRWMFVNGHVYTSHIPFTTEIGGYVFTSH